MVFVTKLTSSGLTSGGNVVGAFLFNFESPFAFDLFNYDFETTT